MERNTVINLEDPSDVHDAVNKQYVDNNYVNISNSRLLVVREHKRHRAYLKF
jgi:hypothetical protein